MSDRLLALIEKARSVEMTPEQERNLEISFAFGNVHYENRRVTREMVERSLPESAAGHAADVKLRALKWVADDHCTRAKPRNGFLGGKERSPPISPDPTPRESDGR